MLNFLKDFEAKLEIKITFSQETERMDLSPPLFSLTTLHFLFFFFSIARRKRNTWIRRRDHTMYVLEN
ncbi:unnamed protein product [Brassica oleracea]